MRSPTVMAASLFFTVLLATPAALANSLGAPAVCTNEPGERCGTAAAFCTRCHANANHVNGPDPTVTVNGLATALDPGSSVVFTLTIHTNDTTGGSVTCASARCAGFQASTDNAGKFVVVANSKTRIAAEANAVDIDNVITHSERHPFVSSDAVFTQYSLAE